jgi:hypothetical protein
MVPEFVRSIQNRAAIVLTLNALLLVGLALLARKLVWNAYAVVRVWLQIRRGKGDIGGVALGPVVELFLILCIVAVSSVTRPWLLLG